MKPMKQLFTMLLALALLLPMLPMQANAAPNGLGVYVNGVEFTSDNCFTGIPCGNGSATLMPANEALTSFYLTLTDAEITANTANAGIFTQHDLSILCSGSSSITAPVGICAGKKLSISGNSGDLTINANAEKEAAIRMEVSSGSLLTIGTDVGVTIKSKYASIETGSMVIRDTARLTAESTKDAAIRAWNGNISVNTSGDVVLKGDKNAVDFRLAGKQLLLSDKIDYVFLESVNGPCVRNYADGTSPIQLPDHFTRDWDQEGYPSGHTLLLKRQLRLIQAVYLTMDPAFVILSPQLSLLSILNTANSYCSAWNPTDEVRYNMRRPKLAYKSGSTFVNVNDNDKIDPGKTYYLEYPLEPVHNFSFSNSSGTTKTFYLNGERYENAPTILRSNGTLSVFVPAGEVVTGTYRVHFDANGGSGTMADLTNKVGATNLPECTFKAPAYHTFSHWSLTPNGRALGYVPVSKDTTVYAVWKELKSYNLTLLPNPGDGEVVFPKTAHPGDKVQVQIFAYPGATATGIIVTPSVPVKQENAYTWSFTMPECDVELYPMYIDSSSLDVYTYEDVYLPVGSYKTVYLSMDAKDSEFKAAEIVEGKLPSGMALAVAVDGVRLSGTCQSTGETSAVIRGTRQDNSYDYHTVRFHAYKPGVDEYTKQTITVPFGRYSYRTLNFLDHGDSLASVALSSGTLPEGMNLSWGPGLVGIAGTPTVPGTYTFSVDAKRSDGSLHNIAVTVIVEADIEEICEYHRFNAGQPVNLELQADAFEFDRFTLAAGALPEGLSLVDHNGLPFLMGTPTEAGLFDAEIMCVRSDKSVIYDHVTIQIIAEACGGDANACPGAGFTDMPKSGNWAHEGIEYVVFHGLMGGTSTTTFAPQMSMSRAMLVTVLYRMEGTPGAGKTTFTDVNPAAWFGPAVSWAADLGIVGGVGGGKFDPNGNVTREQIATILYRYAKVKGYDTKPSADISSFADAGKVGPWFVEGVKWAVAMDLVKGSVTGGKTYVSPQGNATREQVATILMRFCENVAK